MRCPIVQHSSAPSYPRHQKRSHERLLPAADSFRPDFVLVSAGFDSRTQDKLGCFDITDEGYRQMTTRVCAIARKHCAGRVVSVLEGGYNFEGIASGVATHVRALMT